MTIEQDIVLIDDLSGFTMENADREGLRLLLDMCQRNYPGRIGLFLAANAPWYYNLLWKVVKPWLGKDLIERVHIFNDSLDQLRGFIDKDNLLPEHNGNLNFDVDTWLQKQCELEGVEVPTSEEEVEEIFHPSLVHMKYSETLPDATKTGLLKKEGGYVKSLKKFTFVLANGFLYYYKKKEEMCAGFINLEVVNKIVPVSGKKKNFNIETGTRTYYFNCNSESEMSSWVAAIQKAVDQVKK